MTAFEIWQRSRLVLLLGTFCVLSVFVVDTLALAQSAANVPADRRRQLALVIGNAAYRNRPLLNPVHDANDVAARLRELGYSTAALLDGNRKQMAEAVDRFVGSVDTDGVALFYYSGHGVQIDGENYLIPVDFDGQSETDIRYQAQPMCSELLLALSENPSLCFPEAAEAAVAALDFIGAHDKGTETLDWAGRQQQTAAVNSSVRHLWTSAAEFLLQRSEILPTPPVDWRLSIELSCSCPDCQELQTFARDPAERVHRFRVKKERRRHLHRVIDRHRLDMTHVTERAVRLRRWSVMTKDRRTFDQRMKQYQDRRDA